MSFYWYLFLGFLGGIPAGMGMGGGTVTIPLLTLAGGVGQKVAQCANLFAFLPMSLFALKEHAAAGRVKTAGILGVIVPAVCISFAGALLASYLPAKTLGKAFGLFLIVLAFIGLKKQTQTP
ncbi:MAG: sulfite exporter TauE/SafE family protein [Clostridia bacterium]|nr:sulfite exporter TauE/SafE family protein [Clostridia bacterium]